MMLLKGRRPVYGKGAWRNTLLLIALLAVLVAGFLLKKPTPKRGAVTPAGQTGSGTGELARLKMLGHALKLHADEHEGNFPASIADIQWRQKQPGMDWPGLPAAASRFHQPGNGRLMDWLYYPGHTESDPGDTILAASPVAVGPQGDKRLVVRLNSVAEVIPEADFQRQIVEQKVPVVP